MKINKKQFNRWLEALYNEEFPQGKGQLQSLRGYCCLGVACKVLIPENKQEKWEDGILVGYFPTTQLNSPEWLKEINKDFYDKTKKELAYLNDKSNYKFPEIAMILDLVYNYKALD